VDACDEWPNRNAVFFVDEKEGVNYCTPFPAIVWALVSCSNVDKQNDAIAERDTPLFGE